MTRDAIKMGGRVGGAIGWDEERWGWLPRTNSVHIGVGQWWDGACYPV
jgi:hypothetical protein